MSKNIASNTTKTDTEYKNYRRNTFLAEGFSSAPKDRRTFLSDKEIAHLPPEVEKADSQKFERLPDIIDVKEVPLPSPFKVSVEEFEKTIIYISDYNFIPKYLELSGGICPKSFLFQTQVYVSSYKTEFSFSNPFGYTMYLINGTFQDETNKREFTMFRRYTDFCNYYSVLCESFPGLFIPPIPPKQYLGNQEEGFVRLRMKFLQEFFHRICNTPHLALDKFTGLFLEEKIQTFSDLPFEIYHKKPSDILAYYQFYFFFLKDKAVNTKVINFVNDFYASLTNVKNNFENYIAVSTESQNIHRDFKRETENFYVSLYEYDNDFLSEAFSLSKEGKTSFNDDILEIKMNETLFDTKYLSSFDSIYYWVQQELIDTEAMITAIVGIFKYNKLLEDKFADLKSQNEKLYSLNNPGFIGHLLHSTNLHEIEHQNYTVQQTMKDVQILKDLTAWMYKIAYYFEIPLFKENRIKFYNTVIKYIGETEAGIEQKDIQNAEMLNKHCTKILEAYSGSLMEKENEVVVQETEKKQK